MTLADGTVSHCCNVSHQQPATGESDVHQPYMNTCAFALLLNRSDTELPRARVSMSNALMMMSCVKVAAAFLQCSAERIVINAYSSPLCGNRCYTNFWATIPENRL